MKKILMMVALIVAANTQFTSAQSKTNSALNEVLNAYYDLKNALAADKSALAVEKSNVLAAKIDQVPHKDLPSEQHKIWMGETAIIKNKATGLIASTNIKTQRESFAGISSAMIKIVQNIDFNSNTVYVQHCPMAKASWLNENESIENPYYGKMMSDCGDVTATIKSKK